MSGGLHQIACHLSALTPIERELRADLASRVKSSIVSMRELANGYVLTLNREVTGRCVEDLVSLEHRLLSVPAVPFRLGAHGARARGHTGPAGSKELLSQVFGLQDAG